MAFRQIFRAVVPNAPKTPVIDSAVRRDGDRERGIKWGIMEGQMENRMRVDECSPVGWWTLCICEDLQAATKGKRIPSCVYGSTLQAVQQQCIYTPHTHTHTYLLEPNIFV